MRRTSHWTVVSLTLLASVFACGPTLKGTIAVPTLSIPKSIDASASHSRNTYLFVDEFVDARPNKSIALVDRKQEVQSSGEPLPVVVQGLKDSLGNSGFNFSDSAPVILAGELRKWNANVDGRLPTKITSEAQIYLEVMDPANKKVYSGIYNGFSTMESSSIGEAEVRKTLSGAMEEAVAQVTADRQLIGLLQSY